MDTFAEKAAYIKGLAEGLGIDELRPESKVLSKLIDLVSEMASELDENTAAIDALIDDVDDINEHIDAVDLDLADLEDDYYEDYDDEDDYDFDFDEDDEDDEDMDYVIACPKCGGDVVFELEDIVDNAEVECPSCGEKFNLNDRIDEQDEESDD